MFSPNFALNIETLFYIYFYIYNVTNEEYIHILHCHTIFYCLINFKALITLGTICFFLETHLST